MIRERHWRYYYYADTKTLVTLYASAAAYAATLVVCYAITLTGHYLRVRAMALSRWTQTLIITDAATHRYAGKAAEHRAVFQPGMLATPEIYRPHITATQETHTCHGHCHHTSMSLFIYANTYADIIASQPAFQLYFHHILLSPLSPLILQVTALSPLLRDTAADRGDYIAASIGLHYYCKHCLRVCYALYAVIATPAGPSFSRYFQAAGGGYYASKAYARITFILPLRFPPPPSPCLLFAAITPPSSSPWYGEGYYYYMRV